MKPILKRMLSGFLNVVVGEIYFAAHTTHQTRAALSPKLSIYEKVVIVHMRDCLPKIS